MNRDPRIPLTSLGGLIGPSPYNEEEIASLRQRAWIEQGVLIVSAFDNRLTPSEARRVCFIGERLYGQEVCDD